MYLLILAIPIFITGISYQYNENMSQKFIDRLKTISFYYFVCYIVPIVIYYFISISSVLIPYLITVMFKPFCYIIYNKGLYIVFLGLVLIYIEFQSTDRYISRIKSQKIQYTASFLGYILGFTSVPSHGLSISGVIIRVVIIIVISANCIGIIYYYFFRIRKLHSKNMITEQTIKEKRN